jgi:exodeoxyribonuclease VII large subunit
VAELIDNKQVFTLFEVCRSIQNTIVKRYTSSFWVKAELHKLNHYSHSGHCYPELVEKKEGKTIAELRSIIWRDDFVRINNLFKKVLKEPLKDGITVLFCAKVSFDPKYGLTLVISDIDPSYSLGELEREKQLTIEKLKAAGIYDKNQKLVLPRLPKRIAIISVVTSKGYSDFLKIIESNQWNYQLFHMLFPALLQGEKAIESITQQLKRVAAVRQHFDAVAIIRGGGGDVGLSCYNDHKLASAIANFPIPVLTGIGHSTNETVSEMVAFKNAITPTELADFLLQKFNDFSAPVDKAKQLIIDKSRRILTEQNVRLLNSVKYFRSETRALINDNKNRVASYHDALIRNASGVFKNSRLQSSQLLQQFNRITSQAFQQRKLALSQMLSVLKKDAFARLTHARVQINQSKQRISVATPVYLIHQASRLKSLENAVSFMDPVNVLRRGYSITMHQGKVITSKTEVKQGDHISTRFADGEISSEVT